ncbi:MAG: phospholipase, partial [Actinobacteria bacterium]|nr:phospholipase [Actinomycetota bacterium]
MAERLDGRLPRRRFLLGVTALPLVVASCGVDRSVGGGRGRLRPAAQPADDGQLTARPGQPGAMTPRTTGVHQLDLDEGGRALLYVPVDHDPRRASPLAVMFHGAGGSAEDGLAILRGLADGAGLLLVAPQSNGRTWDLLIDGYGPDVALVDQALGEVFAGHAVDPAHLAVGGFSDGASYALSVGAMNGELFSHVLAFSPGFWAPGSTEGSPSFFVTHGTDDQILP